MPSLSSDAKLIKSCIFLKKEKNKLIEKQKPAATQFRGAGFFIYLHHIKKDDYDYH